MKMNGNIVRGSFLIVSALFAVNCGSGSSNNTPPAAVPAATATCTTGAVGTNGYTLNPSTGQCTSTTTGQIAPVTYCQQTSQYPGQYPGAYPGQYPGAYPGQYPNTTGCVAGAGTNGYILNPSTGQCTGPNGQPAPITYCQQSQYPGGYAGNGATAGAICYGSYFSMAQGRYGTCYGSPDNCAGMTLVSQNQQNYGQTVYCQ